MPETGRPAGSTRRLGSKRAILFDLDGTLVDSVADLAYCANQMLADLEIREDLSERIDSTRYRQFVGNGLERFLHRCLTNRMDSLADPKLYERAAVHFETLYQYHNGRHGQLYPGVKATLERLCVAGFRLACVTNKPARFTEALLQRMTLRDCFQTVVAGDTVSSRKPDPAPLQYALTQLGAARSEAIMVGDSISDLHAARAADIDCVCVSYGYNHGQPIREAQPAYLIESLPELLELLELQLP